VNRENRRALKKKLQNKRSRTLAENVLYGTGISEKTNVDVGDDQHLIYLPYNEETILLNDGFRFIMDKNHIHPTVYNIARVDFHSSSSPGIEPSCTQTGI